MVTNLTHGIKLPNPQRTITLRNPEAVTALLQPNAASRRGLTRLFTGVRARELARGSEHATTIDLLEMLRASATVNPASARSKASQTACAYGAWYGAITVA